MIVLLDPTCDRHARFLHVAILCRPDFFFLQTAMEPFDVAVALGVVIRRPSMRNAQPIQCFDKARRSELRSIVGGQSYTSLATSLGKSPEHGLFDRFQCFFRSATMR